MRQGVEGVLVLSIRDRLEHLCEIQLHWCQGQAAISPVGEIENERLLQLCPLPRLDAPVTKLLV